MFSCFCKNGYRRLLVKLLDDCCVATVLAIAPVTLLAFRAQFIHYEVRIAWRQFFLDVCKCTTYGMTMPYKVKEVFLTLQGEGAHTGRVAVFCRFSGCNYWSGKEHDRQSALCRFCDTDFVGTNGTGGGFYSTAPELALKIESLWPAAEGGKRFVVCTGGEPLLQLDSKLIESLHSAQFEIAIETNGSIKVPHGVDWVCVSPKIRGKLAVLSGQELKLVYPQLDCDPEDYRKLDFQHFFLQPMDGAYVKENTVAAVQYCLANPGWRLSTQTHKLLGIR